ncbi:polysaccharide deacetylase family protein [Candidatus Neomarinimicrobiota bacterium]
MLIRALNVIHTVLPGLPHYFIPFGKTYTHIDTKESVVSLSFDDGPHPSYTVDLLEVLREHQVKATFFMVGKKVEQYPHVVQAVIEYGHEIGNHSYSHPFLIFKSCSYIRREINLTDSLLRNAGVENEILFRAPYGAQFLALPIVLRKIKKKNVLFSISPRDWIPQDPSRIAEHVSKRIRPGSIITLHDGDPEGRRIVESTSQIITNLKNQGFKVVTVSELLALGG